MARVANTDRRWLPSFPVNLIAKLGNHREALRHCKSATLVVAATHSALPCSALHPLHHARHSQVRHGVGIGMMPKGRLESQSCWFHFPPHMWVGFWA